MSAEPVEPVFIGPGGSPGQVRAEHVGSKAAELARLSALHLPVPPAFVLPTSLCAGVIAGEDTAMKAMRKVLSWIPGFSYEVVETSCCGMAGSFGLEAEHYDASMRMAELALLPAVRAAADAPLIANGFSCRHQIAHGAGRPARHIALLLRDALAAD